MIPSSSNNHPKRIINPYGDVSVESNCAPATGKGAS
ncbi:MAG: hypothetical protein ACI8V2_002290, partial [Candidatus Latescibacterota bacterium]